MKLVPCERCVQGMSRNKFGAIVTLIAGVRFASKREARRYGELLMLQQAGHIQDLRPHPSFDLWAAGGPQAMTRETTYSWDRRVLILFAPVKIGRYTADSEYVIVDYPEIGAPGEVIVEDVKSRPTLTTSARLRMKIFTANTGQAVRLEY